MNALEIAAAIQKNPPALDAYRNYGTYQGEAVAPRVAAAIDRALAATAEPSLTVIDGEVPTSAKFVWSEELAQSKSAEVDWICRGLLAAGAVTLLFSRPKGGKSTLIGGLLAALADEGESKFIGRELSEGSVRAVLLTEEGAATLKSKLPDGVRVLSREAAFPKPTWHELLESAATEAERIGSKILVVDTFRFWGGLTGDDEKSSGHTQPLLDKAAQVAAERALSVLIVHHSRKGGGDDGDAASGSNAITGGVDIVLELDRVGENAPFQRSIIGLSRFHETPGALVFEWQKDSGKFVPLGEAEDRNAGKQAALASRVLDALEGAGAPLNRTDIEEETGAAWKQILSVLRALEKAGKVVRHGEGKAGSPYTFESVQHSNAQASTDQRLMSVPPVGGTDTDTQVCSTQHRPSTTDLDEAERIEREYGSEFGGAS